MGNRSYLSYKQQNGYKTLFEGNNSMAMFWLMLLTAEEVDPLEEILDKLYDDSEDIDINTEIVVKRKDALALAKSRRNYIENACPDILALFDDWISFLQEEESADDLIYIDISELAGFYSTIESFISELKSLINEFDQGEGDMSFSQSISDLTGFDSMDNDDRFAAYSSHYRALTQARNAVKPTEKRSPIPRIILILVLIAIATAVYMLTRPTAKDSDIVPGITYEELMQKNGKAK